MLLIYRYLFCTTSAALLSIIFYTNYELPKLSAYVNEPKIQLRISNNEWQRFLQLEQLIASALANGNDHTNFGLELDKIFDEMLFLDKLTWHHSIDMIHIGFENNNNNTRKIASILKCYFDYRAAGNMSSTSTTTAIANNHLFAQKVKYFGPTASKRLFATEFNFLASQPALKGENMQTKTQALCELPDIQ